MVVRASEGSGEDTSRECKLKLWTEVKQRKGGKLARECWKESRRNVGGAKIRGDWKEEREEFMMTRGIESYMLVLGEQQETGSYKKIERTNRETQKRDMTKERGIRI